MREADPTAPPSTPRAVPANPVPPVDPADANRAAAVASIGFHSLLRQSTPRAWVTWLFIAANVIVLAAMVASGADVMAPDSARLIAWGADFGPKTLGGEPWRLLSNAFLHFGIVHLAFNMFALNNIGGFIERIYGHARFAALYLVSAASGSLASVAVHPQVVGVGASGAIFGVFGAFAVFLLRQDRAVPPLVMKRLRNSAVSVIGINLFMGFQIKGIDNAAHIGGLLGGAAAGALLARPFVPGVPPPRDLARATLAVIVGGALTLGVLALLPKPTDFLAELNEFLATEQRLGGAYADLVDRSHRGLLSDAECLAELESRILPPWRAAHAKLSANPIWPAPQDKLQALVLRYAELRERGWEEYAEALRTGDAEPARKSRTTQTEADALGDEISRWRP